MTPDEIQKDREAGTPETHEPDYKAAMLYHSDRADAYMSERDAITAENAALKERVAELDAALEYYASDNAWTVQEVEGPYGDYGKRARAALEKSHD